MSQYTQRVLEELKARNPGEPEFHQAATEIFESLAPVEALSAGCPVIAYGKGGSCDYVEDGVNGVLFEKQTVKSLSEAILRFEK